MKMLNRWRLAVHVGGLAWMMAIPGMAHAAPPLNDDSPNATVISALPFAVTADVSEATGSGDDLTRCGALAVTVWYSFTPTTALRVEASAVGNDGSYTALVAYAGVTDRSGERGCGTSGPSGPARVAFDASPGIKYYFVIGSVPFSPGGLPSRIDFSVRQAPPAPDNDTVERPRPIGALPFSDVLDTSYATAGPGDPYCFGQAASVWYSFTPAHDVRVELGTAGSNYGTSISVYTGSPGSLSQIACSSSGIARFAARAGTTYVVMVASTFLGGGNLRFSAAEGPPAPDNDEIEDARAIPAIPFSDTLDTTDATATADDPYCYGQGPTVWYSFTPAADTRVELNTFGSSYAATLSVYTGARGSLSQLACNAFSPGPGARVRFLAQANVTYHVMVGSYFTSTGGTLVLSALPAPPPFTFEFRVDPRASVEASTGAATISGTATCSQAAFVYVSGALRQERPGQAIDAFAFTVFFCDGTTAWSMPVSYSPRLFRGRSVALFVGGKASTSLSATAYSASEGEARSVFVTSDVLLTGSQPK